MNGSCGGTDCDSHSLNATCNSFGGDSIQIAFREFDATLLIFGWGETIADGCDSDSDCSSDSLATRKMIV